MLAGEAQSLKNLGATAVRCASRRSSRRRRSADPPQRDHRRSTSSSKRSKLARSTPVRQFVETREADQLAGQELPRASREGCSLADRRAGGAGTLGTPPAVRAEQIAIIAELEQLHPSRSSASTMQRCASWIESSLRRKASGSMNRHRFNGASVRLRSAHAAPMSMKSLHAVQGDLSARGSSSQVVPARGHAARLG